MTNRPRKTLHSPAPTLPMLLMELEASLPSLMTQPPSLSSALVRVCRSLDPASAPMRQRKPRAARPARAKAASVDTPLSLPLFP
ncbi:hypothetical protein [Paraburkholderia sp. PGU16]|uniref:hypothetical protein n=1 Tax=Paraburkholderia TaxID=1822464 RepID=UPI0015DB5997|nr:hypothetical protein [Paraburkholderia sp. PGU16]BEU21417.1 hypothetical protein PBP221_15570 [Paraburkholderia sp. 22B1P]